MSDATRRADRWLRGHNARGDDMDPCCSCFTCEMATALLAAEARAEKAEREITTLRADLDVAESRKSGVIRGLAKDLDAAREALPRGGAMSPIPPEVAARWRTLVARARRNFPATPGCVPLAWEMADEMERLLARLTDPPGVTGAELLALTREASEKAKAAGLRIDASPPAPVEDDGLDDLLSLVHANWTVDLNTGAYSRDVWKWLRELQARRRGER